MSRNHALASNPEKDEVLKFNIRSGEREMVYAGAPNSSSSLGYVSVCINYRLVPAEVRNESPENFITAATHATEDGMDALLLNKLIRDSGNVCEIYK